jgi:hypothetical protein
VLLHHVLVQQLLVLLEEELEQLDVLAVLGYWWLVCRWFLGFATLWGFISPGSFPYVRQQDVGVC